MVPLQKTKTKIKLNCRGQTFIEALFALSLVLIFIGGLTLLIGTELAKLHLSHVAGDFLICQLSDRPSSSCEQEFFNKTKTIDSLGKVKIIKKKTYTYSSAIEIEFSNGYTKWKLTKTIDLAPPKTAKALSWF